IPTDREAGKRTLAVVLGDPRTRWLYVVLQIAAIAFLVGVAAAETRWALLGLLSLPLAARAVGAVRRNTSGRDLIPVLRDTGMAELVLAIGACVGLVLAA
ncbi:MAG: 1,4-dihydroxy-2-naphthoate polyprenyltransferase, partial [Nocardioidaceae bacterium]